MSCREKQTYAVALERLKTVRKLDDPASRIFFICANLAWEWAMRSPNSWYAKDGHDWVWAGPNKRQQRFLEHLLIVVNDFDVVTSIVYRLEWLRNKFIEQRDFLSPDDLSTFMLADVHAFHVEFRSLMDSLCHLINVASAKPGQVPTDSFKNLRKWCVQSQVRSRSILSNELSELIAEAYWFVEIRNLRDKIIHKQSDALVRIASPPDEIIFFTMKARQGEVYEGPNAFQYNNCIYFRPHAGYYLGQLIFLLNEVCAMAAEHLELSLVDIHWSSSRMSASEGCIDYAINALQSGFPVSDEIRSKFPARDDQKSNSLHNKIMTRAFYLWQAREEEDREDLSDWLLAERQQIRSIRED